MTAIILSIVLALISAGAGIPKLILKGTPVDNLRGHAFTDTQIRLIGGAEAAAAVGLLIGIAVPWLGAAAAAGMTILLLTATGFHVRWGDYGRGRAGVIESLPALILAVFAAVTLGFVIGQT
ncbi:DoxX family protein [Tsukamurella soli]|uniref:DoxX-like family protein n=1 Tax=Tsukamurella soli TaxID=644556 RepID=A0ABP8IZV0_9ACTN